LALQPENGVCCCSQKLFFSGFNTGNHYLIFTSVKSLREVLFVAKDLGDFRQDIAVKLLLKVGVVLHPENIYFGRAELVPLWG
jgi:hypothetical protein